MTAAPKMKAAPDGAAMDERPRKPLKVEYPHDLLAAHAEITKEPHLWREALTKVEGPSNAYRVGLHLIDKCLNKKTSRCFPKQETIARAIGMDARAVRYGLKRLKDLGLAYPKKRAYTGPNDIFFYIPERLRSDTAVAVQDVPEVTQPCRTNRHSGGGGSDTVVADYITLEGTIEERTIEGVSAGEVRGYAGPTDSSSFQSKDLSCSSDLFEADFDLLEEGKYL